MTIDNFNAVAPWFDNLSDQGDFFFVQVMQRNKEKNNVGSSGYVIKDYHFFDKEGNDINLIDVIKDKDVDLFDDLDLKNNISLLEKYLKCFSQERKVDRYKLIFLFLFCTITTSIVNMYKNPTINLLCSICMIYLYSLSFSYSRLYYIILPILYIGLGFVS